MWRQKTSVTEQRPIEVDCASDKLEVLDLRILRILEEAGTGQNLRHARRETDHLAVILIAGGASTFREFDQSLERLEVQRMISLDQEGFASLSERGRDRICPGGPPVPDAGHAPVPAPA